MYKNNRVIVVIPARGGSKGIPRKNIRLLANKPLIAYSIETALSSNYVDDVVVTTDDDEIKFIAEEFGALSIKRSGDLARDDVPLDPVIYDTIKKKEETNESNKKKYDFIITMQPTSPLLKTKTLDKAIEKLHNESIDTVISVVDDRHLSWGFNEKNNSYYPLYNERVNRQYLPKTYKETGGIFATKREFLKETSRLGNNIDLIEVSNHEGIDIDSYEDWWVAERLLNKKRVLIKTDATNEIGTGHIYRGLAICSKLANHDVIFLLNEDKQIGIDIVENYNYPYLTHKSSEINKELIAKIEDYNPDIVINDILNTTQEYIAKLKENSYFVVNFEDIGEGAELADIVFDELNEHHIPSKNVYSGHKYYILKEEFYYQKQKNIKKGENVEEILLTFGGTDPNDLTRKTLKSLLNSSYNKKIVVILGLGYIDKSGIKEEFAKYTNIEIFKNVKNMSEYMYNADLIFTSAGRTMYEIASVGVPCVCLCQNERELTHTFGNAENGFLNLGLGKDLKEEDIINTLEILLNDNDLRREMNKRMSAIDVKHGFENIMTIVKSKYKDFDKKR